jgi:undecaprenyl-diphosphatase
VKETEYVMLELLNSIDIALFRFMNENLSNSFFDFLMPFITDLNKQPFVLALVLALVIWMIIRGNRRVRLAAILLILTVIISDQLSSSIIKFWLDRPRPCRALENVRLLVSCGSGFSFPSSHAVNNFAAAFVLSFFFPRAKWWFFGFAAAVAFSRVYVGVHFPSDVAGGFAIGMIVGAIVIFLSSEIGVLWNRMFHNDSLRNNP